VHCTVVTLTATPGAGFAFSGWSGDLTGSTNPATITMNVNRTVTATFTAMTQGPFTLSRDVTGSGSVSANPNQSSYAAGTVVTLTATPFAGFAFANWSGGLSTTANPTTIVMNATRASWRTSPRSQEAWTSTSMGSAPAQPAAAI